MAGMVLTVLGLIGLVAIIALQLLLLKKSAGLDRDQLKQDIKPLLSEATMQALKEQRELGGQELEEKRKLIDQHIVGMNAELEKVRTAVQGFDLNSTAKMTNVTTRLDEAGKVIGDLRTTTSKLNEILSSSAKRGEWGQRSAKQILDLAGMREGLHYTQQDSTSEGRPDFTFLLPNNLKVNVDSKFPLDNYAAYVKTDNATEKEALKKKFLSDVRGAMKGLTKRDYIDPEGGTVDYSVMYIANEQVFNFVNEYDETFMDDAMKLKVIVCSPFTLFAVVSVIYKAVENFKMEKASREILALLSRFNRQWEDYKGQFDEVEKALDKAREAFAKLITTRANKLEVPLREIERIREKEAIASVDEQ